uniref:Uncharacterized protein n=1 Tax=Panagrolaimus superbus TaxID=310955 RepID=A0A914Z6U1_9BILA
MKESQIRDNINRIVELFEEFHSKTAAEDILQIARTFSHKNFAILHSLWNIRRDYVSKDLLISCFSESTLLGPPLICTMEKFEFEPNISQAIQICLDFGFETKFSVVFESRTSDELAEQLLLRFLKSAFQMPEPNWIMIFDGMKNLRNLLFPEIIDDQKLMKIFASEMLSKLANEKFLGFPFHLVVDINSETSKKLSLENWHDLLLSKSLEFIDRALPKLNDQNLILAREVLTLVPGKQKPSKEIEKQKETISMIETCIQMGSQRLPATYRFCSPEIILQEVISSNKNYKQVKKCAEISKLLGLKPAVAKAMAYCAVEAAKSDDVSTLQKYIQKLNSTCRDMPIIYFVCKDIITSGKWQHLKEDLVNCMKF